MVSDSALPETCLIVGFGECIFGNFAVLKGENDGSSF